MAEKRAAIDVDAMLEKPLDQLSAADFVTVLTSSGASGLHLLRYWPEKKKYELFVEPENYGTVNIGVIFKGVREKKKYEIEKEVLPEDLRKPAGAEFELNFREVLVSPVVQEKLQEIVAKEVARQLRR
jgi:hypothetical protein